MRNCAVIFHATNVNVYSLTVWQETLPYFLYVFSAKKNLFQGLLTDIQLLKKRSLQYEKC